MPGERERITERVPRSAELAEWCSTCASLSRLVSVLVSQPDTKRCEFLFLDWCCAGEATHPNQRTSRRSWCNGIIQASHACDPGSTPGGRSFVLLGVSSCFSVRGCLCSPRTQIYGALRNALIYLVMTASSRDGPRWRAIPDSLIYSVMTASSP